MTSQSGQPAFKFGIFLALMFPYLLLNFYGEKPSTTETLAIAALAITGICIALHFVRNFEEIVGGVLASLLLIVLLSLCALIPVVGWIFDVIMLLYALGSIFEAIKSLTPFVIGAALMWAVFFFTLLPQFHHPLWSPLGYAFFCLVVTSALSKRADPYGTLILLMSSAPLLMMVIASLGKLFQTNVSIGRGGVGQHVSGYTTRAGTSVNAYTRTVTKSIATATTSINPATVATNAAIGRAAKTSKEEPRP